MHLLPEKFLFLSLSLLIPLLLSLGSAFAFLYVKKRENHTTTIATSYPRVLIHRNSYLCLAWAFLVLLCSVSRNAMPGIQRAPHHRPTSGKQIVYNFLLSLSFFQLLFFFFRHTFLPTLMIVIIKRRQTDIS